MTTKILITAVLFIIAAMNISAQTIHQKSVKFESSETAVLVGNEGLAMRTTNSGDNWTVLTTGITANLNSNDFYSYMEEETTHKIHLAVGNNGMIIKSVDDGATWEVKTSNTKENLNDVFILSRMLTAACGDNGTLLYSSDFGDTWINIPTGLIDNFNDILFIEGIDQTVSRELYLAQVTGVIASSTGMMTATGLGASWLQTSSRGIEMNMNSVNYVAGDVLYASGNAGVILKSVNKGSSWEIVNSGTKNNIHEIKLLDDQISAVASCDDGVILNSFDGGATWNTISTVTDNDLYAVNFWSSALGIAVGENGIELYSTDSGKSWIEKEEDNSNVSGNNKLSNNAEELSLLQNYPNPFNPSTIISYAVPYDAYVSVKIYDMTGKEVRTLVNSQMAGGTYSVSFNAANLSSGIYFYVLRASTGSNEISKTMRMILTK